ncbi:YceI family protein [Ruegeria atlantica]|uniref:YceI family protein n=1 Tax=Ruegeria atlantica TaxID=81569 RepID=UPI00147F2086|nr:YceI family protein [Ruegeria atlantica]
MKTNLFATTMFAAAAMASSAFAETWKVDPGHTEVRVYYSHAGFSRQSIEFGTVEGELEFTEGAVADAKANFSIPVSSVVTGNDQFNSDIVGEALFNEANFPIVQFVSTSVEQTGDNTLNVVGDLTIKDVSKPATFEVTVNGYGEHPVGQFFDYYKGQWLGITATTKIKASDWEMGAFFPPNGDELEIVINAELKAQ